MRQQDQELCSPVPPGFVFPFDALPPSAPTGLSGDAPTSVEVDLSWLASTDNVAVTGYTIYRDGTVLGTVDGDTLSYVDTQVSSQTSYTYTVDAYDGAGNHSAESTSVEVSVP